MTATIKAAIILCLIHATAMSRELDTSPNTAIISESNEPELAQLTPHREIALLLREIQRNTQSIASDIGQFITNTLTDIENALATLQGRWSEAINDIYDSVHTLVVAEDECILTGTPLDNVTLGYSADLVDCFENAINMTISLGEQFNDILWKTNKLARDTLHTVDICIESNVASNLLCWTQNLPGIATRTFSLLIETETSMADLLAFYPTSLIRSDACVVIAFTRRSKQAAILLEESFKCFTDHFQNNQTAR